MAEIIIRAATPKDVEELHKLHTYPQVYAQTLQLPYATTEVWEKRLNQTPAGIYHLVAVHENDIVGCVSLDAYQRPRMRHSGTFGISVRHDFQGHGVGSKLMTAMLELTDKWLDLKRIELTVFTDNVGAVALYKKFGFEIEGTSRSYAYRDGDYVDAFHMARLRSFL
ncbi:GNAT family N-acetyltransferase [Hafnia alvei]|uniref:GNAT family N-acetyltransferase n=1 Tax=Hafnia alvei TaxID=569 RepID=UPI00103C76E9|nr:GNAT family N-acetyltransferase [Hafnia alvei]QBJ34978.1 GNAT family N-acetyltransferase [Hafnia alvei]